MVATYVSFFTYSQICTHARTKKRRKFNLINSNQCERIINHFKRLNYHTEIKHTNINNFTAQKLLNIMYQDKKVVSKKLSFILLK